MAIDPAIFTLPSGSVGVQTFVNGADTQTYGSDFLATLPADYGRFGHVDYSLSANYKRHPRDAHPRPAVERVFQGDAARPGRGVVVDRGQHAEVAGRRSAPTGPWASSA
ncbi:MAG: hypothetical protein WDN45_15990 [Caulobacteraceae bacterium]